MCKCLMDGQALVMLYPCKIYPFDLLWDELVTQPKGRLPFGWERFLITTQKEHILDNNSHEFHVFWVVIMPKTLN